MSVASVEAESLHLLRLVSVELTEINLLDINIRAWLLLSEHLTSLFMLLLVFKKFGKRHLVFAFFRKTARRIIDLSLILRAWWLVIHLLVLNLFFPDLITNAFIDASFFERHNWVRNREANLNIEVIIFKILQALFKMNFATGAQNMLTLLSFVIFERRISSV